MCRLLLGGALAALLLSACTFDSVGQLPPPISAATAEDDTPIMDGPEGGMNEAIGRYAALYRVPESLIRRVIVRESGYNPGARHGPYWGLMQIRYDTAESMGYSGPPSGLLNADVNLHYGVQYLSGAYLVARGNPDKAVSFYASGYFYDARRMGLLEEIGLKRGKY